ncbi:MULTISPECIES: hypothetical protein [Vibrio]|uniref:hypothetical protein n=1 Tax=Vibrio TaxID=662 RepID=UPI001CDD4015|nr:MULTISPECIES: hypothetical protein [Vibrio]MCA2489884.1 hypothetical protein [Vibrio alginolyticus]MDW1782669.1 hypothetical protein [Vibrio sp. Vb2134]MDW2086986.1 hypothetical protein [Vibrio sp. 2134-1]
MAVLGEHNILSIAIEDNGPTINWTPQENGEASWQTTPDSSQFIPENLKKMMDGKAPQARFKGAVGGRRSFEMHHFE